MLSLDIKQVPLFILLLGAVLGWSLWWGTKAKYDADEITIATQKGDIQVLKKEKENLLTQSEKTNKELEANSRKIQGLINNANKTSENLKSILKNNQCANTPIPNDAINILRNKGISTNKAADTSKPDTAKRSKAVKQ